MLLHKSIVRTKLYMKSLEIPKGYVEMEQVIRPTIGNCYSYVFQSRSLEKPFIYVSMF